MFNIIQKYIKFFVLFRIKNITYLHWNYLLLYVTIDILEFHLIILSTMLHIFNVLNQNILILFTQGWSYYYIVYIGF